MPEQDFELYLSLLSRFLRLQPAQRDEVADELRDHLDQRLEELAARGLSREQAIHKALEEFGVHPAFEPSHPKMGILVREAAERAV